MRTYTAKQRAKIYLEAAKAYSLTDERFPKGVCQKYFGKHPEDVDWERDFPELYLVNTQNDDVTKMKDNEIHNGRILALLFARQIALNP